MHKAHAAFVNIAAVCMSNAIHYSEGMAVAIDTHCLNIAAAQQSLYVFKAKTLRTPLHTPLSQCAIKTAVMVYFCTCALYSFTHDVSCPHLHGIACLFVLMHRMSSHGTVAYLSACLLKQCGAISSFNDSCTDDLTRLL